MENQKRSQESPLASLNQALRSENDRAAYALKKAGTMFGCYRKGDANDPDIYVAAVAAVLSEYPESVVDFATDPRTGLPSRSKWLPNPAEVREFCEEQMKPARLAEARRKRIEQQQSEQNGGPKTLEERERIAGGFTQLSASLKASLPAEATGEKLQPKSDEAAA